MFTIIKIKRVDQIEVGDIVRSQNNTILAWHEVISVDVDEEMPATTVKVYRPATEDGKIIKQRGHHTAKEIVLPSWDLVDVQVTAMH